ncbi:MAG: glutamate racemase [Candidatus Roizmanbacteria bacterium]|nr:glutamate racemase [Candidatus Roizmanbacteria bacterium]
MASIGVFDSGFGGLTVLKKILQKLPQYNYVYLADSARAPYGNRSKETIYTFTKQAVDFLFSKNCELIILACNTASADALRRIQQEYLPKKYPGKKVLGVLIPGAQDAVALTKNDTVGVIATYATVQSNAFERELHKLNTKIRVVQKACPLLVPLVESNEYELPFAKTILKQYLTPLLKSNIDTLILGCTHYEILIPTIRSVIGKNIAIIAEGAVVAHRLSAYLDNHPEIEIKLTKNKNRLFYTTDVTSQFETMGQLFLGSSFSAILTQWTESIPNQS